MSKTNCRSLRYALLMMCIQSGLHWFLSYSLFVSFCVLWLKLKYIIYIKQVSNRNIFLLGNTISLCITYQILITPLVSSNSSNPIIINVMSYKGQKDYKSCKVQSHTTTPLLIYYKHDIISRIHNLNNNTHLSIIRMGIVCSGPINQ